MAEYPQIFFTEFDIFYLILLSILFCQYCIFAMYTQKNVVPMSLLLKITASLSNYVNRQNEKKTSNI